MSAEGRRVTLVGALALRPALTGVTVIVGGFNPVLPHEWCEKSTLHGDNGVKSTPFLYLIKSIKTAIEIYSVRLRTHQNPLAADLRIPPIHFYGNAADFRSQRISAARGFLQSISMGMLRISAARGFWCARGLTSKSLES